MVKDGEKILSENISNSGYSKTFSYSSNEKITKGNYDFITKFKNKDGKDTSIVSRIKIPNYNPTVNWDNLDMNFEEDSEISINLPIPKDKNPEDNPVNYIPESFSSDKADLEFDSEENSLKIKGIEDIFGNYNVNAEFGSGERGIGSVSKEGMIYELAKLSGVIESNESHEGIRSTLIPYEVIGNDTIRLFSKTADEQGRNLTDASGYFNFKLNKRHEELEDVLLMARQGIPEDYKGWVRVQNIPKEKFKNVLVRIVPYAPYEDRKDEFKKYAAETTIMPPPFPNPEFPFLNTRFDFDGSILEGLPGFEDYTGLKRIRILDEDPYTGGTFTREEQEVFKQKLLDKENINGIIGNYEIKPEQIVFGNDETFKDYVWNENHKPARVNTSEGIIVVIPRKDLYATGVTNTGGFEQFSPIISRGTVYLKAGRYGITTFPHEMGHLFISANHPESLYGETMMSSPFPSEFGGPGSADKKLGSIVYEDSYLVKPEDKLYKRPDYLKNILRDDFK
ncbi:hypothetical protein SAMN05444280_10898 [Tangfeifania diversioriginum]|uniref:Uncharacterized protein n=1 Tax=Tangfeifania diversioriginum TaxID=1168035 RepID=A0A1M6FB77_9BACT|nr:hypothetical protein [Tangfeifania diversioriginum]SHI94901.1 hypothetical protein SAMN05444280_10898 [Tangfeifania diversioriginum]